MPPLLGPTLETRELTVLMRGICQVTVRILRTLRRAEELSACPTVSAAASIVAVPCRRARGTWRRKPFEVAEEVALARARVE